MAALRNFTLSLSLIIAVNFYSHAQTLYGCDQVCGKWLSTDKNLEVQVYKENNSFKAKIIWFDDSDDKTKPMEIRTDTDNPDVNLRTRKVLGMSVLENLVYVPETNSWENGVIYDAKHGRYWDSSAYIDKHGLLRVKGYWHYKWIGKTLSFTKVNSTTGNPLANAR
jgi:uncharacterized protein (DUF2147 family)